jgi:hypothetical protein
MTDLNTYDILLKISEGDSSLIPDFYETTQDKIYDVTVKFNRKNPSQSVVTLQFDSEQYYDLFYDSEDSDFVNRLFDYYNDYDLVGYDTFENEWNEGYLVNMLNPDIIRRIVKNTNPTYKFELNTWGGFESSSEIASILIDKYYREVTGIVSEYESVVNQKLKEDYKENINQDLDNKLTYLNLFEISEGSKYATNIKSLIKLYDKGESDYLKKMTLYEMLKDYCSNMDITRNYYDNTFEDMYNIDPNPEFSKNVEWLLEKMIEESEEHYQNLPDFTDVREMLQVIDKMGGFNIWIDIPKEERKIKFTDVTNENASINFLITKRGGLNNPDYDGSLDSISEKRSVKNMEELNQVLYHPELFELFDIKYDMMLSEQLETNFNKELFKQFYSQNTELFNGKPRPVSVLNTAINDFNTSNKYNVNLNLDTMLKMSKEQNPMFKLDLYFINNGKMERPMWTGNLEYGNDLKFTLSRTPNNNFVPGIKLTF